VEEEKSLASQRESTEESVKNGRFRSVVKTA